MLVQIQFFQHERLIHLIVTALFALLTIISMLASLAIPKQPILLALDLLFLILLIPYIRHYYLLENGVQKLYKYYDKIEILELPDYDYDLKKTLETESNNILKNINLKDYNILLDINSNTYTSLELASKIDKIRSINHNITFIIGGSYGVDERVKNIVQERISFSSLTFPHQLFRVILLEQIYRSFKIINHEEYHK